LPDLLLPLADVGNALRAIATVSPQAGPGDAKIRVVHEEFRNDCWRHRFPSSDTHPDFALRTKKRGFRAKKQPLIATA
jgi:hypothetical protein